jgi:hypothetical protein
MTNAETNLSRRGHSREIAEMLVNSEPQSTPETVPVIFPAAAKKTGLCTASASTGTTVSVSVRRVPADTLLKRRVPPVI